MKPARAKLAALLAALGVALGTLILAPFASAQQPPSGDKDPSRLPLGEIQPGERPMPPRPAGAQPGQPGQAGQPRPMQPGMGRPMPLPGGGRGGAPVPVPPPSHAQPAHDDHAAAHHCPGHGPLDKPHAPNWWQGILMVNNDAATFGPADEHGHFHRTDGFLTQLLYRYENAANECDPKNQPPPFLASLLNFGLLAFVIVRFGKKPLAEALANRKKTMMAEIDNATRLKDEAEARLEDYEDKLQHLDETLEQLKKDYAAQSKAEREHVLAEAEERRARMRRDVEFRLEQELKAARIQLLQESVELAVVAAEELLKKKIAAADQERSADELIAGLAASWSGDATNAGSRAGGAA